MPTGIFYSDASGDDGYIESDSSVYLTARAGNSLTAAAASALMIVGQRHDSGFGIYFCYESFVSFTTSTLGPGARILAVTLEMVLDTDGSTNDYIVTAAVRAWTGGGLTTADWVAGASLAGLTTGGSINTSGIGATGAYKNFAETGTNLRTNVNKTGETAFLVYSSRHSGSNAPGSGVDERTHWRTADHTAGNGSDPRLTVTFATALAEPLMLTYGSMGRA